MPMGSSVPTAMRLQPRMLKGMVNGGSAVPIAEPQAQAARTAPAAPGRTFVATTLAPPVAAGASAPGGAVVSRRAAAPPLSVAMPPPPLPSPGPLSVKRPRFGPLPRTMCITHAECASHRVHKESPEQPARVAAVVSALHELRAEAPTMGFTVVELESSPSMLETLEAQLLGADGSVTDSSSASPAASRASSSRASSDPSPPPARPRTLARTDSVVYLESNILPAVRAVHSAAYLEKLRSTCYQLHLTSQHRKPAGRGSRPKLIRNLSGISGDTYASASSLSAALCAALTACRAVDDVCTAAYRNSFAAIRPPGHHAGAEGTTAGPAAFAAEAKEAAEMTAAAGADYGVLPSPELPPSPAAHRDRCGQGFCLLNNAAIAAKHALLAHPASIKRVAIVDIDLHHGQGTQEIVRGWPECLYASIHGAGEEFYPMTAQTLQREPRLVNVPLPEGTPAAAYVSAFDEHIVPAVRGFAPDLILVSCGFDAHKDDSPSLTGFLELDASDYATVTSRLTELAAECCDGRLVSLLEGGYNLTALRDCTREHVKALARAAVSLP